MRLFSRLGTYGFCCILLAGGTAAPVTAQQLDQTIDTRPFYPARTINTKPTSLEKAGGYSALGVNLMSHIPISAFSDFRGLNVVGANDVWGYVSPAGREYAVIGLIDGTGIVDITDPYNAVIIGVVDDTYSIWSDLAVYDQYVYNVNESSNGIQVINMTQADNGVVTLEREVNGDGWNTAHNIFCNQQSGYLYPCGTNSSAGFGFLVYDLNGDPSDPQPVGAWNDNYGHDLYVVNYDSCPTSPSHIRSGQPCEIAFVFGGGAGLSIVDVTDKSNIFTIIGFVGYPGISYCHQGWLSEDRHYLFVDDETDSAGTGIPSTTFIFDVSNLSTPTYYTSFTNNNLATDHNLMVRRHYVLEANYRSGLRIYDYANINNVQEVGYFKTNFLTEFHSYDGAWGIFAGFPSESVLISDEEEGLFVLNASPTMGCETDAICNDMAPCTADSCSGGVCDNIAVGAGGACDDGEACTIDDTCDGGGQCAGVDVNTVSCADDSACFPATCDTQAGVCTCVPCIAASAPRDESGFVTTKSRFLSLRADNPGELTALRVTLAHLPSPFDAFSGESRWVGLPHDMSELSGLDDTTPPTIKVASLSCDPVLADFGSMGTIHVYGDAIIPGGTYDVQAINENCMNLGESTFSSALRLTTSKWCDAVGDCTTNPCSAPNGSVDVVFDVVALIDKFANHVGAVSKVRADMSGDTPDLIIGITDINDAIGAFQGRLYPYSGPSTCN